MPTNWTGDPTAVSSKFSLPSNIASSTNTTPIKILASTTGLVTGAYVEIRNHLVNTNANGIWKVTVIVPNVQFSLDGSVGNGVGGATGQVKDITLRPQYQLPSDGDAIDAASVNVALETLGDRTNYLLGGYKLVDIASQAFSDTGSLVTFATFTGNTPFVNGVYFDSAPLNFALAGDIIEVSLLLNIQNNYSLSGDINVLSMVRTENGGSETPIPGVDIGIMGIKDTLPIQISGTMSGTFTVVTSGICKIGIDGFVDDPGAGFYIKMIGSYSLTAKQWRPM